MPHPAKLDPVYETAKQLILDTKIQLFNLYIGAWVDVETLNPNASQIDAQLNTIEGLFNIERFKWSTRSTTKKKCQ